MNNFLNTQTNIMSLQFGRDKCVKLHIGKTKNHDVFTECKVYAWKDGIVKHEDGHKELEDVYIGKEVMRNVEYKWLYPCFIRRRKKMPFQQTMI